MNISDKTYATHPKGKKVTQYTVENSNGISFKAITYGATLTEVNIPDKDNKIENVILGYDRLEDYMERSPYYGALVGRFANRIKNGVFYLDGKEYSLALNDVIDTGSGSASNHLHGGNIGFDKVLWKAKTFKSGDTAGVNWSYTSPDGEEGYPGNLKISATYSLNEKNELTFEYHAFTNKATPVNLTQHAYWNLSGAGSGTVLDQAIKFDCPFYIPVDSTLMPTGEILSVKGTPFDFTETKKIGKDLSKVSGGFDHCLIVKSSNKELDHLCLCKDPKSGRTMEVWTNQPGVQFYTGNFIEDDPGAKGATYPKHAAFTLETQQFPDCVNIGHFPSCILRPGQTYYHKSVHRFSV